MQKHTQNLSSRTMTKRNVAQSTVIFSVVVVFITLAVIGAAAYLDFSEDIKQADQEKSIPERIADQKRKAKVQELEFALELQASDLVAKADERVQALKKLQQNINKVNQKIAIVADKLENKIQPIAQAQQRLLNSQILRKLADLKAKEDYQNRLNFYFAMQNQTQFEAYYNVSMVFKARASADISNEWNAKYF